MTLANQLNMDIFVAAPAFCTLASKSFDLAAYRDLASWVDYKTFVPPMMFNNSGNMRIQLVAPAFGQEALAAAIVPFIVEMTLHFPLGAYILDQRTRFSRLLRMPMIIATLLGLAVA